MPDVFDDLRQHIRSIEAQRRAYRKPVLVLLRKPDSGGPRHGGWRTYRHFELYLNDVLIRVYRDDDPGMGYRIGSTLDTMIKSDIERIERALGIRCIRARVNGDLELAGYAGMDKFYGRRC